MPPLTRHLFALTVLCAAAATAWTERDLSQLDVLKDNYPRAFFFRASEQAQNAARYPTVDPWEAQFDRLQGIIGKCLEEECLGRLKRNPEFFNTFKQRHPNQVVLLHFNGNSRDPLFQADRYFAGHWIYRRAVMVTKDVPAEAGESVIHVSDARDFRVNMGRYRTSNDDLALFALTPEGKHDWYHCEQMQLLAVNQKAKTIRVKRGCYGTQPLAFKAGRSRAAAHAVEGPWGKTNHLLWFYNYSTHCPRDRNGKTCADLLVDDLARWFSPTGVLHRFDGLEFDVLHNLTHGDTDGDGQLDGGQREGLNNYGIGVVEFIRQLRQRMGNNFIIQADGALGPGGQRSQRAFGLLNGIESEGWPNLNDWEFDDWSGGLNRHFFWRDNAFPPAFSYVNHKWIEPVPGQPGMSRHPRVPFSRHRLALAACQFFGAMVCYSFAPPADPDGKFGIWDELRCGVDSKLGWLGKPEGPAVRLARETPELLAGQGVGEALARRLSGSIKAEVTPQGVRLVSTDPKANDLRFSLDGIPTNGADLTAFVELSAETLPGYPREMARFAQVGASGGMLDLLAGPPLETGMKRRSDKEEVPLDNASGASVRRGLASLGGTTLTAFFTHPPYQGGVGYTFWTRDASVPPNAELRFSLGMGEKSPERSDGVWFRVYVAEVTAAGLGDYQQLFEATSKESRWLPQAVSLADYAGKRVRLKFVADCGPRDNSTTDHAHWGDVKIVRAGADETNFTPLRQHMTWVNDRPFEASFYFPHLRSEEVNLSFVIEGTAPVTLHSVAVYACPDLIYRVFEHGLVLANPSRQPYTFDLAKLSPGRKYRRLQATAKQDLETNNGQPVGAQVTLNERDGLFLARIP